MFGKSWDFLADVERVRSANQVFGKLPHKLGHVNWLVVDLHKAVRLDDLDAINHRALASVGWLVHVFIVVGLELHARGDMVVARDMETHWDHLESEKPHTHSAQTLERKKLMSERLQLRGQKGLCILWRRNGGEGVRLRIDYKAS